MQIEVLVRNDDGSVDTIMAAPLNSGQPGVGDKLFMHISTGAVIFQVFDRQWHFEENKDGGGMASSLKLIVTKIGMVPKAQEEEGDKDDNANVPKL